MNYKEKNLYQKIYRAFIRGEYGPPTIPSKSQVLDKMSEITSSDYVPILEDSRMGNIDIDHIRKNFSNIIDDIDVLFDSVESESNDILGQLTNSLKEHNGAKRELRKINTRVNDLSNGKLGEEYLQYGYTENFNDVEKIDTYRSDPISTDAGIVTIRRGQDNIFPLRHYFGKKIQFNITENFARIIEKGYVGSTDAGTMLDQEDPRQLVYKITTNAPTPLNVSFSLQLLPDGGMAEVNAVTLDVDSQIARGAIRLYYKDKFQWKDVRAQSIKQIKSDKVNFTFPNVKTSHIRIEFIKDGPDVAETNTYQYIINNIAVARGTARKKSVIISKPITFDKYSKEIPVVSTIGASGSFDIPPNCDLKLYVAQDKIISGAFVNSEGAKVDYTSPEVYEFNPSYSGTVYLSEIWASEPSLSGITPYLDVDYNWLPIKIKNQKGERIPKIIEFDNTKKHDKLDNSLFSVIKYILYGDTEYDGTYTVSGWVNTDNPQWGVLEPLVDSGILTSGIDVASSLGIAWEDIEDLDGVLHPDISSSPSYSGQWIGYSSGVGYPYGYWNPESEDYIKFGDYTQATNGWWRPYSDNVTPTGLDASISSGNQLIESMVTTLPDFYFNNIPFYKIYKFAKTNTVIDNTVKLFTYQERPVVGDDNYYPANFIWNYKSSWVDEIGIRKDVKDENFTGTGWTDYVLPVSGDLRTNEEYVIDSISQIKIKGTSVVLDESEYNDQLLYDENNNLSGVVLSNLNSTRPHLKPSNATFSYKYQYRVRNNYLSTWTGFAIISPGANNPTVSIENPNVEDERNIPVIKNIVVENIQTGEKITVDPDGNLFTLTFELDDNVVGDQYFKITIFCASNEDTGFCANNWVPYESDRFTQSTINVSPYVKLVPKITPITMVDLSTLIYDTPMNNNSRAAIYEQANGEKFVVVKTPSKDIFPGYYFDSLNKAYVTDQGTKIKNIGHWIREGSLRESGVNGYNTIVFYYTTGSDSDGVVYKKDRTTIDTSWNEGATIPDFPNYTGVDFYGHHSTYGHPINIDSQQYDTFTLYTGDYDPRAEWSKSKVGSAAWNAEFPTDASNLHEINGVEVTSLNRGFLYYPTAENLPTFYSVSYRSVSSIDDTNNRFLYKLELISNEDGSLAPTVDSLKFMVNRNQ